MESKRKCESELLLQKEKGDIDRYGDRGRENEREVNDRDIERQGGRRREEERGREGERERWVGSKS